MSKIYHDAPRPSDGIQWNTKKIPKRVEIRINPALDGTYKVIYYNEDWFDSGAEILTVEELIERGFARRVEPEPVVGVSVHTTVTVVSSSRPAASNVPWECDDMGDILLPKCITRAVRVGTYYYTSYTRIKTLKIMDELKQMGFFCSENEKLKFWPDDVRSNPNVTMKPVYVAMRNDDLGPGSYRVQHKREFNARSNKGILNCRYDQLVANGYADSFRVAPSAVVSAHIGAPRAVDGIAWITKNITADVESITINTFRDGTYNLKMKGQPREVLTVEQLIAKGYARRINDTAAVVDTPRTEPAVQPIAERQPATTVVEPTPLEALATAQQEDSAPNADAAVQQPSEPVVPQEEPVAVQPQTAEESVVESVVDVEQPVADNAQPNVEQSVDGIASTDTSDSNVAVDTPRQPADDSVVAEPIADAPVAEQPTEDAPLDDDSANLTDGDVELTESVVVVVEETEEEKRKKKQAAMLQQLMDAYHYDDILDMVVTEPGGVDPLTQQWRDVVDNRAVDFVDLQGNKYTDQIGKDKTKVTLTVQTLCNLLKDADEFVDYTAEQYGDLESEDVVPAQPDNTPLTITLALLQSKGAVSTKLNAQDTLFFVLDNGHSVNQTRQIFEIAEQDRAMFYFDPNALPFFITSLD